MAGFETIVRPVVFPNIRPQPTPAVPPADDPTKGVCVISGQNGTLVTFADSYSISSSQSRPIERRRRYDLVRVYQKEDDGTVNKDNFVDVEVANKIWMQESGAGAPSSGSGVPVKEDTDYVPTTMEVAHSYFNLGKAQFDPAGNIEILQRNQIKTNPDAGQ